MSSFTKTMTRRNVLDEVRDLLTETIEELIKWDDLLEMSDDDKFEAIQDRMHEILDGHEWVIYNYQARLVVEAMDIDIFDVDEMTGERYTSWNQAAYMAMYNELYNNDFLNAIEDVVETQEK